MVVSVKAFFMDSGDGTVLAVEPSSTGSIQCLNDLFYNR